MSVAERVAAERKCEIGEEVGYSVRFANTVGPNTVLRYATDGVLLRELIGDPKLSKYACVILDEVHERTLSTDILMGVLRDLVHQREDLTVVLMSATLDTDKFSQFFNCGVLDIPGRLFDVETFHLETDDRSTADAGYLNATIDQTKALLTDEETQKGDILVFLPGTDDIHSAVAEIEQFAERFHTDNEGLSSITVLPLYGSLPLSQQRKVFTPPPPGGRKVIFATNVAETSITIDGIEHVIDPGLVKEMAYDPESRSDRLKTVPISQASAVQRRGRAGRTRAGTVYRLYSESLFSQMAKETSPAFIRSNLTSVVLQMLGLGLNPSTFSFIDPPPPAAVRSALRTLTDLGAVTVDPTTSAPELTGVGIKLNRLPIAPEYGVMLLRSAELGITGPVLTLIAMMEVPSVVLRDFSPGGRDRISASSFADSTSDHRTLINIYNEFIKQQKLEEDDAGLDRWCLSRRLSARSLLTAVNVRDQLSNLCSTVRVGDSGAGTPVDPSDDKLQRCILRGFYRNVCAHGGSAGGGLRLLSLNTKDEGIMPGVTGWTPHPSSFVRGKAPRTDRATGEIIKDRPWYVFNKQFETRRKYLLTLTRIQPSLLLSDMPHVFSSAALKDAADTRTLDVMKIVERSVAGVGKAGRRRVKRLR